MDGLLLSCHNRGVLVIMFWKCFRWNWKGISVFKIFFVLPVKIFALRDTVRLVIYLDMGLNRFLTGSPMENDIKMIKNQIWFNHPYGSLRSPSIYHSLFIIYHWWWPSVTVTIWTSVCCYQHSILTLTKLSTYKLMFLILLIAFCMIPILLSNRGKNSPGSVRKRIWIDFSLQKLKINNSLNDK